MEATDIIESIAHDGFYLWKGGISPEEAKSIRDEIESWSDREVKRSSGPFCTRKKLEGRGGTECFVTINDKENRNHIEIKGEAFLKYMRLHNKVVSYLLGDEVTDDSNCFLVWQHYKEAQENYLPYHIDGPSFKGDYREESTECKEGLFNRYTMLVILEDENDGTLVSFKNNDVTIDMDIEAGDILFFDNVDFVHGILDSTPKERFSVSFRTVENKPIYYSEEPFENCVPYHVCQFKGYAKQLTKEEAKRLLEEKRFMRKGK